MKSNEWILEGIKSPQPFYLEYFWPEGNEWRMGRCMGRVRGLYVVVDEEDDMAQMCPPYHLRPIRTERDIEIDRMKAKIMEWCRSNHSSLDPYQGISETLYDAGYRKVEGDT